MYTVAFLEYRMDAVLKPTPDVAPVTMVTFPVKSGMSFSTKVGFGGKIWPRAGAIGCECGVYVCMWYGILCLEESGNVRWLRLGIETHTWIIMVNL